MKKDVERAVVTYTHFLNPDGTPTEDFPKDISKEKLVSWYKTMVLARVFSRRSVELQRTGQMGTFASSEGQEAIGVGYASSMLPDDVLFTPYREYAAAMVRAKSARIMRELAKKMKNLRHIRLNETSS